MILASILTGSELRSHLYICLSRNTVYHRERVSWYPKPERLTFYVLVYHGPHMRPVKYFTWLFDMVNVLSV